ncbi:hypothetical protein BC830DRAFT_817273 [Chytriomyces sp. MP71]|nr:hypothetical protein BC830DRAFT_817273 [Chytriomyces sp. MP71]
MTTHSINTAHEYPFRNSIIFTLSTTTDAVGGAHSDGTLYTANPKTNNKGHISQSPIAAPFKHKKRKPVSKLFTSHRTRSPRNLATLTHTSSFTSARARARPVYRNKNAHNIPFSKRRPELGCTHQIRVLRALACALEDALRIRVRGGARDRASLEVRFVNCGENGEFTCEVVLYDCECHFG